MSKKVKITLGKYTPKTYQIPDAGELIKHPYGETIMFFGDVLYNQRNVRLVFGIGRVQKISHGNMFDLVYMTFGGDKQRKIMVQDNKARRMIMTIKRGQLAMFYGYGRIYVGENEETGKKKRFWQFFAWGFQGWYIPKMFEVKKMLKEDETDMDDMTIQDEEYMTNFIDRFKD